MHKEWTSKDVYYKAQGNLRLETEMHENILPSFNNKFLPGWTEL